MKKLFLLFIAIIGFAVMSNNASAQTKPTTEKSAAKTEQTKSTSGNAMNKDKSVASDKSDSKINEGKTTSDKKNEKTGCGSKAKCSEKCSGHEKAASKSCKH